MDTLQAFTRGVASRGNSSKVFDWNKAATIIKKEQPISASAGLDMDWEWTGGEIWNGKIVPERETYTYLASTWATPKLEYDGIVIDCYIMEEDVPEEWSKNYAKIYWPQSARNIIEDK